MKSKSNKIIYSSDSSWETLSDGISRQILGFDDQLMMVKVKFAKGAIGYEHLHFHSQCSYIVKGCFEVTINGEKQILRAGDGFYAEPEMVHGVICLEDGELIDAFSPPRQDFL